jgi:hypothetical protein
MAGAILAHLPPWIEFLPRLSVAGAEAAALELAKPASANTPATRSRYTP